MSELYKKHRPTAFSQVLGQDPTVQMIKQWVKDDEVPHSILFTGPSGCGKTTLARILASQLECHKTDYQELNSADMRGIDKAREIRTRMMSRPLYSECKIWLFDEAHRWTKDCQNAMLKPLEDTPRHVYFFLCTTNPESLLKTIRTRCADAHLRPITDGVLMKLLKSTCHAEKTTIHKEVAEKIVANSDGSARKAMVHLGSVLRLSGKAAMLEAIQTEEAERQAIDIARMLFQPKDWKGMAKLLSKCQDEEPEQLRWMILGYAKSIMLKNPKMTGRAYLVIDAFRDNFYDSKHAGLAAACYEVLANK